jgi:FlaA1/EpsC-like NDP-sugar epimerase
MHSEKAAVVIVEAASLSALDDCLMLEMGDRKCIEDLAYKMIRLRGWRPNVDMPLENTGLRPGEKLHEKLVCADEQRVETAHPRVFQITSPATPSLLGTRLGRSARDFATACGPPGFHHTAGRHCRGVS